MVALALSNLPRWWTGLHTPPDQVFLQTIWAGFDEPQLVEVVREAASGHLLTSARVWGAPPGSHYLLYPPVALVGWLVRPGFGDAITALGWMRLVMEPAALAAAWLFIRAAVPEGRRAWAYFFAVLAGGLGFLFFSEPPTPLGPALPSDINQPSFNLLNSLHMQPHVAWSVAGVALFAWGFVTAVNGRRRAFWGLAGAAAAAIVHPWELLGALVAAGLIALLLRDGPARVPGGFRPLPLGYVVAAGLVALPYPLYLFSLRLAGDVVAGQWGGGLTTEAQDVPSVILASAFLWPFALIGARAAVRDRDPIGLFCLTWLAWSLVVGLLPALAPTPLHRSLEGRSLALAVLATRGLAPLASRWRPYLLGACLISPILQFPLLIALGASDSELYLSRGDVALASSMDAGGLHGTVLGTPQTMRWVVVLSQTRVALDDQSRAKQDVQRIVKSSPEEQSALLRADGADWLAWGSAEHHRYGPPPQGLRVVMEREGSYLLAPA